jgi:hypothetical protein
MDRVDTASRSAKARHVSAAFFFFFLRRVCGVWSRRTAARTLGSSWIGPCSALRLLQLLRLDIWLAGWLAVGGGSGSRKLPRGQIHAGGDRGYGTQTDGQTTELHPARCGNNTKPSELPPLQCSPRAWSRLRCWSVRTRARVALLEDGSPLDTSSVYDPSIHHPGNKPIRLRPASAVRSGCLGVAAGRVAGWSVRRQRCQARRTGAGANEPPFVSRRRVAEFEIVPPDQDHGQERKVDKDRPRGSGAGGNAFFLALLLGGIVEARLVGSGEYLRAVCDFRAEETGQICEADHAESSGCITDRVLAWRTIGIFIHLVHVFRPADSEACVHRSSLECMQTALLAHPM